MMRFWRDRSIRFRPDRRRPDDWADVHDRARSLAAERLSEPLGPGDAAWLVEHLATCPPCQEVATAYERQREALRALAAPEPPRDLWARTAAALDQEAAGGRGARRAGSAARRRPARPSPIGRVVPYGALAGALVVGVVVGASLLARRTPPIATASPTPSLNASLPIATPIAVPAGPVAWLERRDDGTYALAVASVGQVCPGTAGVDCPPITPPQEIALALRGEPRAVVRSPTSDRLIVVVSGATGGQVLVVPLPSPAPTVVPSLTPSPSPIPSEGVASEPPGSTSPAASPAPTATPVRPRSSASPSGPAPSPSPIPPSSPVESSSTPPPSEAPASEAPSASPTPTLRPVPSTTPTEARSAAPSAESSSGPSPVPTASPVETSPSPSATPLEPVAILDGVAVVGDTAAWSASGRWFAFSARPTSGFGGPDVYVWSPDEPMARPLTTDGRSVFSAWLGDWIVASRVVERADGTIADVVLGSGQPFLIDPETGTEIGLDVVDMWRPVVDPSGRWAVYWHGSLRPSDDGRSWVPATGALVLGPWPGGLPPDAYRPETEGGASSPPGEPGAAPTASATEGTLGSSATPTPTLGGPIRGRRSPSPAVSPSPSPAGSPGPSVSPSPAASLGSSPEPSDLVLPEGLTALVRGDLRDWEVRWDPTGNRFAVWIADAVDPSVGRLSLFTIDPTTGVLDPSAPGLRDEPALAGFALGLGRLAWAVPPGQGGEPSHVRILAWTGTEVGTAVSQPGPGTIPVIIVR